MLTIDENFKELFEHPGDELDFVDDPHREMMRADDIASFIRDGPEMGDAPVRLTANERRNLEELLNHSRAADDDKPDQL